MSGGRPARARRALLAAATNSTVRRLVGRYGRRLGARRFVAGETLDEALAVLRRLDGEGFATNTTLLGENAPDEATTARVVAAYEETLERIAGERLSTNISLKLTHLGLLIDEELSYGNLERLARRAQSLRNFVRIDMEESRHVDATLRSYRRLREAGLENVGTVLQSSLRRTDADLVSLADLRPNLRLVKGAYLEPATVAYPAKAEVDSAYARLGERMLHVCSFVAFATHDERLIRLAVSTAAQLGVDRHSFQIQMLYGIRPRLQRLLLAEGIPVLVATPYGPDWYPYLVRRLAERPANVLFLARNLLRR